MSADVIHEPTAEFPFAQITLTAPVAITGGNHYMKYLVHGKPLYLQTPVCKTKGGLHIDLSNNKRPYCDLMFTNENEAWIRWMEELESHTCKYIFDRKEKWFASDMDMSDIENYFQSPLKIYKSGKFYLARTNIPSRLGKVTLKVYDDSEREVDPNTITDEMDVMTIVQVQGIKCSSRSFQVELELKQMLVLSPTNVFERCLLLGSSSGRKSLSEQQEEETWADKNHVVEQTSYAVVAPPPRDSGGVNLSSELQSPQEEIKDVAVAEKEEEIQRVQNDELLAVDVSLDDSSEAMEIKPRNEVFYEIYRAARQKAKEARAIALAAYLEAKHIKNTYNIQDDDDDDDDVADDAPLKPEA
jgi:hypothetical protein